MVSRVPVQVGVISTRGNLESRMLDVVKKGILTLPTVVASATITTSRMKSPRIP
jgi:hypothetical protein